MFNLSYKYLHQFYLPCGIYNNIQEIGEDTALDAIKNTIDQSDFKVNKYKINTQKVSEYLYLVTIKFKTAPDLDIFKLFMNQFKELFPPWLVFPNYAECYISWDQGFQYDYCILTWLPYWKSLTSSDKDNYLDKYPYSEEWKEWLETKETNF